MMENKFEANIVLCKTITEDNEFCGVFNNVTINKDEEKESTVFDMAIFFSTNIQKAKEESLLIDIVYLDSQDNNKPVYPVGSITRQFDTIGINKGVSIFRNNKIKFDWEGYYAVEVRHSEVVIEASKATIEDAKNAFNNSELVSTFVFNVVREKK